MKSIVIFVCICLAVGSASAAAPPDSTLIPDTPAGAAFRAFYAAYGDGSFAAFERFVGEHYRPDVDRRDKAGDWQELRDKYGPARLHAVSLDKPHDLELWMHGTITRAWFAVELILDPETNRIRAVGILQGERPEGVSAERYADATLPLALAPYLQRMADTGYFAGTVLIARGDSTLYDGAFGLADPARSTPVRADTRFRIASVTKMFTAVAIAQLAEAGALDMDDPIGRVLPELPKDFGETVTIAHLLTHRSGIELDGIAPFNAAKRAAPSAEALLGVQLRFLDALRSDGRFAPSFDYDYSNEGYDLAGLIVERVSGQRLPDYLAEHVLARAGMNHTAYLAPDTRREDLAVGLTHRADTDYRFVEAAVPADHFYAHAALGSSGLASTAGDLRRFAAALFRSDRLLTPASRARLVSAQVTLGPTEAYGYGVQRRTWSGALSLGHDGGMEGASAELRYFPDADVTLVVLANRRTIASTVADEITTRLDLP